VGLALLLPGPFEWSRRGVATRATRPAIASVARAVLRQQPGLHGLAMELVPYARWIGGAEAGHEGLPPPVLWGVEDLRPPRAGQHYRGSGGEAA
jgi:hypothetical protein